MIPHSFVSIFHSSTPVPYLYAGLQLEEMLQALADVIDEMTDSVACEFTQRSSKTFTKAAFDQAMVDEAGIVTKAELTLP